MHDLLALRHARKCKVVTMTTPAARALVCYRRLPSERYEAKYAVRAPNDHAQIGHHDCVRWVSKSRLLCVVDWAL
jgi:hypothetical protein